MKSYKENLQKILKLKTTITFTETAVEILKDENSKKTS